MKLVEQKIKRYKEPIAGILLGEGAQWSLIRVNVVDYVLDGLQFTNRDYLAGQREIEENTLRHKILSIKNEAPGLPVFDEPGALDDSNLLYTRLQESGTLVAVGRHHEDSILVGKIVKVSAKSFGLDTYDTDLQNCGVDTIEFSKVRYLQIHSDYLDSLSLIVDSQ